MCVMTYAHRLRARTPRTPHQALFRRRPADLPAASPY